MPGKKKLDEEYQEITQKEIDKEIKKTEEKIKKAKRGLFKFRLKTFRNDLIFTLIISGILGFILWAWKPEIFSYAKSLALGLAWYMLFEELRLQNLFKQK